MSAWAKFACVDWLACVVDDDNGDATTFGDPPPSSSPSAAGGGAGGRNGGDRHRCDNRTGVDGFIRLATWGSGFELLVSGVSNSRRTPSCSDGVKLSLRLLLPWFWWPPLLLLLLLAEENTLSLDRLWCLVAATKPAPSSSRFCWGVGPLSSFDRS